MSEQQVLTGIVGIYVAYENDVRNDEMEALQCFMRSMISWYALFKR